jgi:hypothetical protein
MSEYLPKELLTPSEKKFYEYKLKPLLKKHDLIALPQVCVGALLKGNSKYLQYSYRVDFTVTDENFNVKFLIEYNDKSHVDKEQRYKDFNAMFAEAGILLFNVTAYHISANGEANNIDPVAVNISEIEQELQKAEYNKKSKFFSKRQ